MMHQPFVRTPQARTASATRSKRSNSASKATSSTNTRKSSPLRPHVDATRSDRPQRTPAEAERSTGSGTERRPRSVVYRTHEPSDKAARLRGRFVTHNSYQEDDNIDDDEPPVPVPTGLPAAYALPLASLTSAHGTMSPSTLLSASSRREPSTRLSNGPTLLQGVCAAMSTMTVSRSSKSQIRSSVPRSASPPLTTSPSRPRNSRTEKEKHAVVGVKYAAHDNNDDEQEPSMRGGSTSKVNTSLTSTTWHAPGRAMAPVAHIRIRPLLSYLGETQEMRRVFFLDHENMVISTRHPAERAHTTGTRSDVSTSLSSTRTHGQNITQAPSHAHRTTTTTNNNNNNMTSHMAGIVGSKRNTSQVLKSNAKDETPLVSCSPSEVSLAAEEEDDEHGSNSRSMSNRLSEVSLNSSPADFTMQGEGEQHVIDSAHTGLPSAVPLHSHQYQQPLHSMTKAATVADLRVPSPPKPHSHQHGHRGNHTGRYKSPRIPASTHSSPLQSTTQLGSSGNAGREEVTGHTVSGEATASGHGVNTSFTGLNGPSSKTHYFSFEFIHDEDATQEDVFEESVLRFADEALLAHNVAILCYGPTGSGKTYSMMGGGQEGRPYHADTTGKGSAMKWNVTDEPSTEPASRSGSSSPRQTSAVRCSASKADKPQSTSGGEAREESWPAVTSSTSTGLYRPGNAALLLLDEEAAMRSLGGAHSGEMGLLPRLVLVLLDRRGVSVSLVREREEKSAAPATSISNHGRAMTTRRQGVNTTTPIPRRATNTTTTSSNTRSPQKQGAAPSTSSHPRSVSASKGRSRSATGKQAKPQTPVSTNSNSAAPMQTPRTRHAASRGLRQLSLTLQSLTFYGVELYNDELADLLDPAKRPIPNVSDLGGLEALCAQLDQARSSNTNSSTGGNVNGSRVGEGQTPRTARARNTSNNSCGGGMVIDTLEDLRRAYCLARRNRVTSSHKLNDTSSRSHAVFILQLSFTLRESAVDKTGVATEEGKAYDEEHIRSYVVLVDLAGCERVKETQVAGTALREAQYINRSLSALSSVVLALYRRSSHIPYRDSKLTRLLRPCLQDGRVLTLVHVAPCSVTNTIHALQFADRVRHTLMPMHNRVDEGKRGLLALFEELVDPSQGQLEADLHESEQRYNVLCAEVRLAYLIRYQNEQQEREEGGAETTTSSQAVSGTETTAAALGVGVESRGGRRPRGANSKALPGATRGAHHNKGQTTTTTTSSTGETMLAPALHTLPTATIQRHKTPSSTTTTTTAGNTTGGSKGKSRSALQEARAAALREMIAHYLAPLRANEEAETEAAIHRIEQERDRRIAACVRRCATAEARLRGALEELTKCNAQLLQENASPLPTDPYTTELTRELQRTNEAIGDTTRETQVMSGLVSTLRQRLALQEELMAATEADLQAALRREFTSSTTNISPMPTSNLITNTIPMSSSPPQLPSATNTTTSNTLIAGGGVRPPPTSNSNNNPNDDTSFATSSWMLDTLATVTDPGTAPATTNSLLSSLPLLSTSPAEAPLTTTTITSVGGGAEEQSWREVCEQQILLAKEMAALRREVVCQEMGEAVWEGLWSRAMRTHMAVALMRECAMMERILCNKDALRAWLQPTLTASQDTVLGVSRSDSEATRFAELPATQRADWACVISYLTRGSHEEEGQVKSETVSKSQVDESVSKGQIMQNLATTTTASPSAVSMAGVADPFSTTTQSIMPTLSLVGMESTLVSSATTTTPYFDVCGNDDEGALQQAALATLLSHGVWCEACVVTESWSSIARRYTDLVQQQQQHSKNTTNAAHSASPASSTTSSTTSSSARTSYNESEYQNNDDETEMRRQDTELRTANTSMNGRSLGQSRRGRRAAKYTDGWLLATSAATELRCGHLRLRQNTSTNTNNSDSVQQASYVLEFCEAANETDNGVNHTSSGDAAAAAEGHPYHNSNSNNNTRASVEPPAGSSSSCYFALPLSEPTLHFTIHLIESGAMDIARRPHHHSTRTNITSVSEAALMSSCPFLAIEIVGVPAHVPRSAQRTNSHSPSSPMTMSGLSTHERHAAYASHVPTTNTTQGSPLSNSSMTTTTTTTVPVSRRGSLTLPSAVWHTGASHNSSTGKDTKTTSRVAHQASASFSSSSHFTRDGTTRCTILLRHGPPCTRHTIMSAVTQAETIVAALSALLLPSSTPLHNNNSTANATRAAQQTGPRTQRQHATGSTATPRGAMTKSVQITASKATSTVTRETPAHTASESIVSVVYKHLPTALLPQAAALVKANESTLATRLGASSSSTTPRSTKAQGATGLKSQTRGKALASNANTKSSSQSGNKKAAALTTTTSSSPALQASTLQVFIHMSPLPPIEDWLTSNNTTTTTTTIDTAGESSVPVHNSAAFTTDAMLLAMSQLCRVVAALDSLRRAHVPHYRDEAQQLLTSQANTSLPLREKAMRFASIWLRRLRALRRHVRATVRQDIYDAEDIKGEPIPSAIQNSSTNETTSHLLEIMREANALLRLRFAPALLNQQTTHSLQLQEKDASNTSDDNVPQLPLTLTEARVLGAMWHVPWTVWQWSYRWPVLQKMYTPTTNSDSSGAQVQPQLSWAAQLTAWLAQTPQPSTTFTTAFSQRSFSPLATHREPWCSEESSSSSSSNNSSMVMMHEASDHCHPHNNHTTGKLGATTNSATQDVLRPVATTRLCLQPLPPHMTCMTTQ